MALTIPRHKVFISYHHANDEAYRIKFEALFSDKHDIMVSKAVQDDDIDPNLPADTIRRIIRDNYLRDSTVTVVLIGAETWQRKHVDWEIGSSIRETRHSSRSGLLGILLPAHPGTKTNYNEKTIPPRLHDNIERGFATIENWNSAPEKVAGWIHEAFLRRNTIIPDNSFPNFTKNRHGAGWQR